MDQDIDKTIEEYIEKAPEAIKKMLADGSWTRNANSIAEKFKIGSEKTSDFKNEIVFVLIGMEPKTDFTENIKNELGIDSNMANWIVEDVEKNIFSKVADELDEMWQTSEQEEPEEKPKENPQQNNVGESFEQIILNEAKAMREAIPPENLPVDNSEPKAVNNYLNKEDPYREPME